MPKHKLAVLISGRGSNMEALARAAQAPDYPAEIILVAASKANAAGLETAAAMGLPTLAIPARDHPTRDSFDAALTAALEAHGTQAIALAGFMRILTPGFIRRWQGRIVNIHPSLLPKYPGLDTHARALAAGDAHGGCTVHIVTETLDDGPILAQAQVPILPGDTADMLAQRVLEQEHQLYPRALATFLATLP
jgi:formyltetrahydrofolate-dependent phosphoribosylglycinamide formyltransferase